MGYNMKRGNSGVKFKNLGSSPAKQDEDFPTKKPNPYVASDIALEDYDPKEDDDKEEERINRPPATKPPLIAEVLDQDK